jgi:hypothetical protein
MAEDSQAGRFITFTQVSDVKKIEEVKGRYAAFGGEDRGH